MRFPLPLRLLVGVALGGVLAPACTEPTTVFIQSDSDGGHPNDDDDDGLTDAATSTDASSNEDSAVDDVPVADAAVIPKKDASVLPGADGGLCPGAAPTVAALDADGGWKAPPAKVLGACSPANITTFQGNFSGAQSYADLKAGLPAACVSCIFSIETQATWKFVVTDAAGDLGFFNYGACYARATNGSNACGKAIQYNEFCIDQSCSGCATSSSASSACQSDSQTQGQCSANFAAGIQAGCGTNQAKLTGLDAACATPAKAVNILCGTGS